MRPTYLNPKKPTMKDHLKSLWLNARSLIYAGLTLGGILVVLLGSILLLPLILILIFSFNNLLRLNIHACFKRIGSYYPFLFICF